MDSFRVSRGGGTPRKQVPKFSSVALGLADSTSSCGSGRFLHGSPTLAATTLWDSNTAYASKLLLVLVLRESG